MTEYKSKGRQIGTIWLGSVAERAQVLEALRQHHVALKRRRVSLPIQLDSRWQKFADNVERKLDPHELIALPDIVKNSYPHGPPGWNDEFLSALAAGGEVWEYKIKFFGRLRFEESGGWCVALNGQIASLICYTSS